jgi:hypothetical protein
LVPRRAEAQREQRWNHALVAAVFVLTALYRFNTLGGSLAGFDNDHFLHFTYAKQVEAGEQPLRDFLDGGLQGARPSLTYELSAAAQSLLGDNLRSEALLSVGGVALAAALTFAAARAVAPWYYALACTALTVLIAPKLYNYPKVLVLAALAWLVVRYAQQPGMRWAASLGAWIAAAFLFRHDYAVYCALAAAIVILAAGGQTVAQRLARVAVCAALSVALVAPSLWWIERYAGLRVYVANAASMGERERARTGHDWPLPESVGWWPTDFFASEQNAVFWLYYVLPALPALWLVFLAARAWRGVHRPHDAALAALAIMTLPLYPLFVRGNLAGRFADVAPPLAVVGAALLAAACGAYQPRPSRRRLAGTAFAAAVILIATTLSVSAIGSVPHELAQSGLSESPRAAIRQTARVFGDLGAMPSSIWRDQEATHSMAAARYLNRCTADDDRVLVATYAPEILPLADRRFAGGRATIVPGFYTEEEYGPITTARLEARPPIVVLMEDDYLEEFPKLRAWIEERYVDGGVADVDSGRKLRVLARRDRTPVGTFEATGLPCFR